MLKKLLLILIHVSVFNFVSFSQKGPGGVSHETPGDSDCKVWFSADRLPLLDEEDVYFLEDISLSAIEDSAFQTDDNLKPLYRDDVAAGINGKPIIRFDGGDYLLMNASDDINTGGARRQKTAFVAFKTGGDISTFQMIYEQGGGARGLNFYIENDSVYAGAYDNVIDGDNTPEWYGYAHNKVEEYTTYIISFIYDVPELPANNTDGSITAWVNGDLFSDTILTGVGALWSHGDNPCLGAVRGGARKDRIQTVPVPSPFLGDFAEFISYEQSLNEAERIIVQNYLATKYSANTLTDDFYAHKVGYGEDLIGIGEGNSTADIHDESQGNNPFVIQSASFTSNNYFFIGHDGNDNTNWVNSGFTSKINLEHLSRTWKVDQTGTINPITFTVDSTLIPDLNSGFSKIGLAVETSGGVNPNWDIATIYELDNGGSGALFTGSINIPDNAFVTIVAINPTAYFLNQTDFGYEADGPNTSVNITAYLNYTPLTNTAVDYTVVANSATLTFDYDNFSPANTIVFNAGSDNVVFSFEIVNDNTQESTEDFTIQLDATGGVGVQNNALVYTINDDDYPPVVEFNQTTYTFNENAGTVSITVNRTTDLTPTVSVDYILKSGDEGTASSGVDYVFTSGTLNFSTTQASETFTLDITEDLIKESTETIKLVLTNPNSCAINPSANETVISITDNDLDPEVQFSLSNLTSPETNGSPQIEVLLNVPSASVVSVNYTITGGTATSGLDYYCANTGVINFAPGEVSKVIPITVSLDLLSESDETVVFTLSSPINAVLASSNLIHTLTITDYLEYEWDGVAGVGKDEDVALWIDANRQPYSNTDIVTALSDASVNGLNIFTSSSNPTYSNTVPNNNGMPAIQFYGSNPITGASDVSINTDTEYTNKDIFIVFQATNSTRQTIFSQGGSGRGFVIYLDADNTINANFYNNSSADFPEDAWGSNSGNGIVSVTSSSTINLNQTYILYIKFDYYGSNNLELYLNGVLEDFVPSDPTQPRRMGGHSPSIIGGHRSGMYYIDGTNTVTNFNGYISEFIYYNNETEIKGFRRELIENSLAAKYGVTLGANDYVSSAYNSTYVYDLAGLGRTLSGYHLDAQGAGEVRVNTPSSLDNGDILLWGHNNLSNQQAPDYTDVPSGVNNRHHRAYKFHHRNDLGTVNLTFNNLYTENISNGDDLVLLIDEDGVFINATQYSSGRVYNSTARTVMFTGVTISDGDIITLGSLSSSSVLPVELISYSATLENGISVLNWRTLTEKNNDYFMIEKSTDGLNYEVLGYVSGNGTSSKTSNYNFEDLNPEIGNNYYKLSQVDFDGTKEDLGVRVVQLNNDSEVSSVIYPNPVNRGEKYSLQVANWNEEVFVEIYDLQGKEILKYKFENNFSTVIDFETSIFPNHGVYIIKVISDKVEEFKLSIK